MSHINPSPGVRLSPPLARSNLAAELHIDHRDEVSSVERAPVRPAVHEPVEPRLLVERQFQDIGDRDAGKTSHRASMTGLRYHAMRIMSPESQNPRESQRQNSFAQVI